MPTLSGIYERLHTGAAAEPRSGAFVEPSAGPAATGYNLREVLNAAPALDTGNGAAAGDVLAGRTFWGLRGDAWGRQTGSVPWPGVAEGGQTTCHDGAGAVIACAGTGQDGALQTGVAWPAPRFTDNSNGTVTDNLTGLVWLRDANCTETVGGVGKGAGYLTRADALTWSNNLGNGNCGLTDGSVAGAWRLPSRMELLSLVDLQFYGPALSDTTGTGQWSNGNPFISVQSDGYWSSTAYVASPTASWCVILSSGYTSYDSWSGSYYVWPVRGGL